VVVPVSVLSVLTPYTNARASAQTGLPHPSGPELAEKNRSRVNASEVPVSSIILIFFRGRLKRLAIHSRPSLREDNSASPRTSIAVKTSRREKSQWKYYNGMPCSSTPRSGYTQLTGLCTKKATIRVRRIRRKALQPSTEITGPSLRKLFISVRMCVCRARLRSPRGNGREDRAGSRSSGLGFWRSRKSIFKRAALYMRFVLSEPLHASGTLESSARTAKPWNRKRALSTALYRQRFARVRCAAGLSSWQSTDTLAKLRAGSGSDRNVS